MSFLSDVKEELINIQSSQRHCRLSELSAILAFAGKNETGSIIVSPTSENAAALRKCFTLLNKTFNIDTGVFQKDVEKNKTYIEFNRDTAGMDKVIEAVSKEAPKYILDNDCCKRAYLRGAFISSGYVNDLEKKYHLEIVANDESKAEMLCEILGDFDIEARVVARKRYHVVYMKDADSIQDMLNVIGAHKALMEFANARVVKDFRNDLNRRINCEVTNEKRALTAASKQIDDINFIKEREGLDGLPEQLKEVAELRLSHPGSSFAELGELLEPPVGKSGINHRMRKLSEYAQALRQSKGE